MTQLTPEQIMARELELLNTPKRLRLPRTIHIPKGIVLYSIGLDYELMISIGNNHVAKLSISEDALRVLTSLEPDISIT